MESKSVLRKPDWIRTRVPSGVEWKRVDEILTRRGLHTVCDEAHCPNKGECWGHGTATFMVLGDVCTRGCRFCAVATAKVGRPVRPEEAEELAAAVEELGLKYAVVTSVDRDDLEDRGASHFASCVRAIKARIPSTKVEVLIPDYREGEIEIIVESKPDVIAHNVETVRRLQSVRDARAGFDSSLKTLRLAKERGVPLTKSSIMLGLGETREEVLSTMDELRINGVDILVLGQYLRPSSAQVEVSEYIEPARFDEYAALGRARGFSSVVAAPFARTSYHALEAWNAHGDRARGDGLGAEDRDKRRDKRGQSSMNVQAIGKPAGAKLIRLAATIENGIVVSISIRGDFFAIPEEGFERAEARLPGTELGKFAARFDELLTEEGVEPYGISGATVAEVLDDAIRAAVGLK